jgi:hypothetical protein
MLSEKKLSELRESCLRFQRRKLTDSGQKKNLVNLGNGPRGEGSVIEVLEHVLYRKEVKGLDDGPIGPPVRVTGTTVRKRSKKFYQHRREPLHVNSERREM